MCEQDKESYEKEAMEIFREVKFFLKFLFYFIIIIVNLAFVFEIMRLFN